MPSQMIIYQRMNENEDGHCSEVHMKRVLGIPI